MATTHATEPSTGSIRSLIPARIDRLTWSRFHTRLIMALGVAWILDGLEITIASAIGPLLGNKETLHLSSGAIGDIATWYLVGEVAGALFFGHLSDKLGRRNLFTITLGVYLIGSALTAATAGSGTGWVVFFYATRVIAGMGIGGEYAAINSAIDELIPAHYRGRVDIGVNGTYWAGSILGTLLSLRPVESRRQHEHRLAAGVLARAGARLRHHLRAEEPAGKPALATDARPRGRGRGVVEADRTADPRLRRRAAARRREQEPSRSSRRTTSASSRWPGCCSRSTRHDRCSARP